MNDPRPAMGEAPAAGEVSYPELLRRDYGELIDALDLDPLQKHFLRSRWLDQVLWMEGRANAARRWYYRLRITAIVLGVVVPSLISWNVGGAEGSGWRVMPTLIVFLSLVVTVSTALEEFFHFGERWRHYRRTLERLKTEGWHYFQRSGIYEKLSGHREAYPAFAAAVEGILQQDVDTFITRVVQEKAAEKKDKAADSRG